jgi:hypothetical protein
MAENDDRSRVVSRYLAIARLCRCLVSATATLTLGYACISSVTAAEQLHQTASGELDLIAHAVEGAESSYGMNPRMWRTDPDGPQGPMQVSRAAAIDVGDGNRFNETENRSLGRAYLGLMHRRYGNWSDALAAYNWGARRVDTWISRGRDADQLPSTVAGYVRHVLRNKPGISGAWAAKSPYQTLSPIAAAPTSNANGSALCYYGWKGQSTDIHGVDRGHPADHRLGVSRLAYAGWDASQR